jgi:OmpA-OmpF porin, OOP family
MLIKFYKACIMHSKKICLLVSLLGCFLFARAQFVADYLVAADKYFTNGDYYSAAQYYEKYMGQGRSTSTQPSYQPYAVSAASGKKITATASSKQRAIYNLAESYRKLHYHEKAAPYYLEAVNFNNAAFPLAQFYYATTMRALEKYEEAAAAFTAFKATYTGDDIYAATAAREIENLQYVQKQLGRKDLTLYTVQKNAALNSTGGNYAPVWISDSMVWFTSTRPQGMDKTTTNRIYQSQGSPGVVTAVNIPQPKDIQQGVVSSTPDGHTLFITRWDIEKNKKTASLYISKKQDGSWTAPTPAIELNAPNSNTQQPMVMPDGKNIVFASDRPGGLGGFDLWMAALDSNGNAGTPVNMGSTINTALDEQAPAYHAASHTFIFSTNGRTGMGGYDFFYSKGDLSGLSEPVNFGYPVNSVKDDLYFTSRGSANNVLENVVFSSDRDASCCLELFSLNKIKPLKQVSGLVVSCIDNKPLAAVTVVIVDTIHNKVIAERMTDANGRYSYTLEAYVPLTAAASNSGYFKNSISIAGPEDEEAAMFSNPDLCLNPITEKAITVDNVYYDFNKATLQESSYPGLDKLVQLLNDNPAMLIELGAHTDSKGDDEYNLKLSDARARAVVDYLVSEGIDKGRLVAKGYGESVPVAENTNPDGTDNPDGRQQNRRTEFKVLKN